MEIMGQRRLRSNHYCGYYGIVERLSSLKEDILLLHYCVCFDESLGFGYHRLNQTLILVPQTSRTFSNE